MRWLYYYRSSPMPSGGLRQVRLTARLLAEIGVETYLLRHAADLESGADDGHFYGVDVPSWPVPFEAVGPSLATDDVVLLPECWLAETVPVAAGWKCRKAVNNQNGFFALRDRIPPADLRAVLDFAVANAPYVATICRDYLGMPADRVFLVPHWVVREPFTPRPDDRPRRLAVAYMPRKLSTMHPHIREAVGLARPGVEWVPIDHVPADRVADTLRSVKLFLAVQHDEGCPLPALEAMTCGTAVAGFPGTRPFPHPYATPDNGWWAREYSVPAAAAAVVAAFDACRDGTNEYRDKLAAGLRTADRYSRDQVQVALEAMVDRVTRDDYSPQADDRFARLSVPARLWTSHFLYRHNTLYLWGA